MSDADASRSLDSFTGYHLHRCPDCSNDVKCVSGLEVEMKDAENGQVDEYRKNLNSSRRASFYDMYQLADWVFSLANPLFPNLVLRQAPVLPE